MSNLKFKKGEKENEFIVETIENAKDFYGVLNSTIDLGKNTEIYKHPFENKKFEGHNFDYVAKGNFEPDEWEEVLIETFGRPIDQILEKGSSRESFDGVYFHKGYLLATNGSILIKQNLLNYSFLPHQIKAIEGKFLTTIAFEKIRGFDYMDVRPDKIICFSGSMKTRAEFEYHDLEKNYPDYEAIMRDQELSFEVYSVGLNFANLKKISPLLLEKNGSAEFRFTGENKAVFIKSIGYDWFEETILLMPIIIDSGDKF